MLTCAITDVPFPAFETLDDRIKLPRRYFLFFDLFLRAGRHNKEWWNDATFRKPGEETKRFASTMIEAHVKTTIRENYFRWMFQILADHRCIPEHSMAQNFKTEYDFKKKEDFPEDLACSLTPLARLPKTCEIRYHTAETSEEEQEEELEGEETCRTTMGRFTILTEEKEEEDYRAQQLEQRKLIMMIASKHGKEHKDRLELMRSQVKLVRENCDNLDSNDLKKAQADTKKN